MEIVEIKQRLPLAQVLQHYGLKPDKSHRLHCPFHDDRTPSLQVYYKTQTCYCFSSNCKTHGKALDVIDFVMYKEGCSKGEAIQYCKTLIGGAPAAAAMSTLSRTQVLGRMFTYFKNGSHNSKPAQDYIKSRGLDATQLEIGYNSGQFHHGQRKDTELITACEQVGLLAAWGTNTREGGQAYKAFGRNCIVFALRNSGHQVCSLYFRSITSDTDQRHFYLKDRSGLYPCYPAAGTQRLILTESVIDAAVLVQHSFVMKQYSVLACYGTNGFTPEHRSAIAGLPHLTEIIFAFDGDDAGKAATDKYSIQLRELLPHVQQSFLPIPAGEDLASVAAGHEPDVLEHLLTERKPLFTFPENPVERTSTTAQTISSTLDSTDPYKLRYATITAVYTVQGGVSKAPDSMKVTLVIEHPSGSKRRNKLDLYEDKQVERLAREVATALGLDVVNVADDLRNLTDALDAYRDSQREKKADPAANV